MDTESRHVSQRVPLSAEWLVLIAVVAVCLALLGYAVLSSTGIVLPRLEAIGPDDGLPFRWLR